MLNKCMVNRKPTTVPTLSGPLLTLLTFADTYSLCSTKNMPFQTNINLIATSIERSAFVSAFKKQFSSLKTAHYAHIEAQVLTIEKTKNVRLCALKVQQLVDKGWCNESAATINHSCKEILTRRLSKNRKALLINDKLSIHLLSWNLTFPFIHWLNLLMLKILRMKKVALLIYHWRLTMYH